MKDEAKIKQSHDEYMITRIGESDRYYVARSLLISRICYPIGIYTNRQGRMYGQVKLKSPGIYTIRPYFTDFNIIKRRGFLLPGLKYPKRIERLPYVTTSTSVGGPKAVLMKWDNELGFYEPWNTGPGQRNMKEARKYARDWAEAEGIEFVAQWGYKMISIEGDLR